MTVQFFELCKNVFLNSFVYIVFLRETLYLTVFYVSQVHLAVLFLIYKIVNSLEVTAGLFKYV